MVLACALIARRQNVSILRVGEDKALDKRFVTGHQAIGTDSIISSLVRASRAGSRSGPRSRIDRIISSRMFSDHCAAQIELPLCVEANQKIS